jgi:AcrR family transcriptional regulator
MNSESPDELRARRRAARIATNRADILDAAERTFAERGITEGSLRDIAKSAGFSTAALYNYFDSKQQLLAETLIRRGTELLEVIDRAADEAATPMAKLHRIVDATVAFFATYPDFRRMLRRAREADETLAAALTQHASDQVPQVARTFALMTGIVKDGQRSGEIRDGNADALTHLYMTLVYEHVFLAAGDNPIGALTLEQFQGLIDGALRVSDAGRRRDRRQTP